MPANAIVCLAPLTIEHIRRYMPLSGDPELLETMGWVPFNEGEEERFLSSALTVTVPACAGDSHVIFSIVATAGEKPIGYVCLKGINRAGSVAELGIAIMDKACRGAGQGTAALRLALDHAFKELNIEKVALTVFPANTRAIRSYEKAGFKPVETLRKSWRMPDGTLADMLLMEASRS